MSGEAVQDKAHIPLSAAPARIDRLSRASLDAEIGSPRRIGRWWPRNTGWDES
jgi:hypothetical protein